MKRRIRMIEKIQMKMKLKYKIMKEMATIKMAKTKKSMLTIEKVKMKGKSK